MNTKKFLYAPALFTALALIATSECLAIGAALSVSGRSCYRGRLVCYGAHLGIKTFLLNRVGNGGLESSIERRY